MNAYTSLSSVYNLPRWFWMIQLLPRCCKIRQSTSGWSYLLSVLSLLWCYLWRQRSITFLLFSGSNIDLIKSARCVIVASETTIQMSHIANETDGKLLLHKCSFSTATLSDVMMDSISYYIWFSTPPFPVNISWWYHKMEAFHLKAG